jgi:antitoxin VapB
MSALNIKSDEAHALAAEIAAATGVSLTEAVIAALREKRARIAGDRSVDERAEALLAYGRRFRAALGDRPVPGDAEMWDELGLPR